MAPKKERIVCSKPNCKGSCPAHVVARAGRPGGTPAKCHECGKVFKLPPGYDTKGTGGKGDAGDAAGLRKQLAEANRKVEALEKEKTAAAKTSRAPDSEGDDAMDGVEDEVAQKLKGTYDRLRELRDMPEGLRELLFQGTGTFDAKVKELEELRDNLAAAKRGRRPLADQEASAKAHEARVAKARETAEEELAGLVQQQADLAATADAKRAEVAKLVDQHARATAEVCELAARYAAERRQQAGVPPPPAPAPAAVSQEDMQLLASLLGPLLAQGGEAPRLRGILAKLGSPGGGGAASSGAPAGAGGPPQAAPVPQQPVLLQLPQPLQAGQQQQGQHQQQPLPLQPAPAVPAVEWPAFAPVAHPVPRQPPAAADGGRGGDEGAEEGARERSRSAHGASATAWENAAAEGA